MQSNRRALFASVVILATLTVSAFTGVAQAVHTTRPQQPASYIVVLDDATLSAKAVANAHTELYGAQVTHVYEHALKGYAATLTDSAASAIARLPQVLWVERDKVHTTLAQTLPTGVNRIDGELSSTAAGNGSGAVDVDVAVLDTGIDLDHPDLNVYRSKACTGSSGDDGNGHGSHVAGSIAAKDDGNGVVGVAPGARLWAVKVLGNGGSGMTSWIICGIDYVTANASSIEVANMSLGGGGSDDGNCGNTNNDAEHKAICRSVGAGVTYAVAAGNEHTDAKNSVPASYDEVITVSALADFNGLAGGGAAATCRSDADDSFANYSNYGLDVDVIAPGTCINSTWKNGGYNTISGTSMASPHVAGAAALYKSTHPSASPAEVKTALQSAGNLNYTATVSEDPDGVKELLINVDSF